MAKTVKGSAFYDDNGGYIFTPYEQGKPENVTWLPLKTVENGKLECSKNKVRIVLTIKRGDIGFVCTAFSTALGKLISAFMMEKRIQSIYLKAKDMKPCEIEAAETDEEEQPMHGY